MRAIQATVFLTLAIVLLEAAQFGQARLMWKKRFIGYCNSQSTNCGAGCNVAGDCQGGACWAGQDTCLTPSFAGTCNAASSKCGTPCNILSDCPGGDCWKNAQTCTTPSTTRYCNAASDNCGNACNTRDECPSGDCKTGRESCGPVTGHVIGTYLGALPGGITAPPLSAVPADVNFILLGFAKDVSYNGNFVPFTEWTRLGITNAAITQDKATNPKRKYLVSLGGAAGFGGTFNIAGGLSVQQWLDNAYASIKTMVDGLNADGVDVQFEGGTTNANFPAAVRGLLKRFKDAGYITSVGPYYGGTWSAYVNLNLQNADYVFCQFYAKNLQTVASVENDLKQAAADLGGWGKLIAGFNSLGRNPSPRIALQAVNNLRNSLKGTFTWAAEHSKSNNPAYCIEKNSRKILVNKKAPGACSW